MAILGKKIVYIHAPKCGGTTIGSALRMRYLYSQATIPLEASNALRRRVWPDAEGAESIYREHEMRDVMLAQLLERDIKCVSAHIRFNPNIRRTAPDWMYATLLRDPIKRFTSHYLYSHRRHPKAQRPTSFDEFLETDEAVRFGSIYLFYFSMRFQPREGLEESQIATARERLASFDLVGTLEKLDTFKARLEAATGVRIYPITRNTRPDGEKLELTPVQRARVERLCYPDIQLYEFAQKLQKATV